MTTCLARILSISEISMGTKASLRAAALASAVAQGGEERRWAHSVFQSTDRVEGCVFWGKIIYRKVEFPKT